jgi:hypothetical protein
MINPTDGTPPASTPTWPRAAIYFSPAADTPLHIFGSNWLGRDAISGALCHQPAIPGIDPQRLHHLTRSPRRYGFHATLRAPFHPTDNVTIAQIIDHAAVFAHTQDCFEIPLHIENDKGFLALTPRAPSAALAALESALLTHFDPMVQPPSLTEITRRRRSNLSAVQDAHLLRWGYPYVLDQFNFHMTLSDRISDGDEAAFLLGQLNQRAANIIAAPILFDAISVFVEAEKGGDFRAAARLPFNA